MACAEGDLLNLGEVLVDGPVQDKFTNVDLGDELFGPDLGGVEDVKVKVVLVGFRDDLDRESPLGRSAGLDGLGKILAMEVC
jgi:hypothetical protein